MKFKAPKNTSSVGFGGKEYEVDEDGLVDLPAEAAPHVAPHGVTPHTELSPAELKAKKAVADKAAKLVKLSEKDLLAELEDGELSPAELKAVQDAESSSKEPREAVLEALAELLA